MKHSAIHTGILPYYCDGCGDSFKTNDDLIAHRLEEICGEKFAWKSLLKVHQRVHGLKTPYKCKICAKRFKYSVLKLYHMIEASHGLPYDYYQCNNLKIITKSIVRSVMTEDKNKLVVKTESNKLSPESSEKVLPNVKVTKPVTRTEPIESKICTFCNSKFSTSAMLKLHIQNEHSIYLAYYTQINFQCDENKQIEKTEITHQGRNNEVGRIEILPTVEASKVAPASFDEEMLQSLMATIFDNN
ncbi:hypothetical protein C0J52_01692 [Blattella germanica]|nr:hypothetical protein C0J52_01692 [Blattella germanica]